MTGIVYLVGAGPGDPGLITRRGAECIARADVVIYDRLVAPELLNLAKMFEHHVMGVKVGKNGKAFTSLELECFIREMIQKAEGGA